MSDSTPTTKSVRITVHIVTWNNVSTIGACLESVFAQSGLPAGSSLSVAVTDNASKDGTAQLVKDRFGSRIDLVLNTNNEGFCRAHNSGIEKAILGGTDYVLILNPDVRLAETALARLVEVLQEDPRAGFATPKLLRANDALEPVSPTRFDAAGMFITPSIRHFDRGSEQEDTWQFEQTEYVFGGTGAALLVRTNFIHDLNLRGGKTGRLELFDEKFFAYREDADLAWRAAWLGWRCRYVPAAVGYHRRVVLPEKRSSLPAGLNAYGVRNRFLLQLNNLSLGLLLQNLIPLSLRNLVVCGAVIFQERTSLPGLREVFRLAPRALRQRRLLMRRRRLPALSVGRWFGKRPITRGAIDYVPAAREVRSISIIVVNFNSGEHLTQCLRAISQAILELQHRIKIRVVIADNGSTDSSALKARAAFEKLGEFRFELLSRNLGFAGANNAAALMVPADAYLILNPDVEITGGAIEQLARDLSRYQNLGAIGPVYESAQGEMQRGYTGRSFPTLGSTLAELFYLHRLWPKNPWTQEYLSSDDDFLENYLKRVSPEAMAPAESLEHPCVVDQPAAAALLIRSDVFQKLDGFDARFWPAWFEDVDLCKRIRAAGFVSGVDSRVRVRHVGGHSLKSLTAATFVRAWYPNLCLFWQKHGGRSERFALRVLLPVALLLRAVVSFFSALTSLRSSSLAVDKFELSQALIRLVFTAWSDAGRANRR